MSYRIMMRDLPSEERPREKLLRHGAERLSNSELLAILLGSGTKSLSALRLAEHLLTKFGSLRGLANASCEEMTSVKGVGAVKAAVILAAFELAKRLADSSMEVREVITCPRDAADLVRNDLARADKEYFMVIMLNTKHRVIGKKVISIGHLSGSLVHPRELFKEVIRRSSAAVIVVHNHPSGDPTPSREDIGVTKRLVEAGELLGIQVLDHIVVGDNCYVSFREQGLL